MINAVWGKMKNLVGTQINVVLLSLGTKEQTGKFRCRRLPSTFVMTNFDDNKINNEIFE